jgi:hypothetical protein
LTGLDQRDERLVKTPFIDLGFSHRFADSQIVSGGQTGADSAALDWALSRRIECGGWCPKGLKAEDGEIAKRYPLIETPAAACLQRTEWNVRDIGGTVIFSIGKLPQEHDSLSMIP